MVSTNNAPEEWRDMDSSNEQGEYVPCQVSGNVPMLDTSDNWQACGAIIELLHRTWRRAVQSRQGKESVTDIIKVIVK
jgi:hypothetical protein